MGSKNVNIQSAVKLSMLLLTLKKDNATMFQRNTDQLFRVAEGHFISIENLTLAWSFNGWLTPAVANQLMHYLIGLFTSGVASYNPAYTSRKVDRIGATIEVLACHGACAEAYKEKWDRTNPFFGHTFQKGKEAFMFLQASPKERNQAMSGESNRICNDIWDVIDKYARAVI